MLALSDQNTDDGIVIHDEDFLQTFGKSLEICYWINVVVIQRLEKALDDEASANRTELHQGQHEKEHRVCSVLPAAKFL